MQTLVPTWNLGDTATAKWYVRLFPSLNDVAFLLPVIVLFAKLNGTQLLFADGDTGWHIRTGEWILAHHQVPTTDLFSFTKSNQAWFAWEWAWDVIFAAIHRCAGLAGIGFVTTAILGVFSLLVYRLALRACSNNLISIAVTALVVGVSSIHWLARPHLLSWIFTLLFLNAIASAQEGRFRSLYLLPLLMVFWVNLHGGFVAGVLILGCYALGEVFNRLAECKLSAESLDLVRIGHETAPYWKSLALCVAATFVNPYGWGLHQHIFNYLTDSELLDKIQEFQSISFHAGPAIFFEIMLLLSAFVVLRRIVALDFAPVLLICLWAHFALLSARHIPLFMIVAAPFVATLLTAALEDSSRIPAIQALAATVKDICDEFRAVEFAPRLHLASGVSLLVVAALFALGQPPFAPQFNADSFPAQAIPVLESRAGSHIFTTDQWGDYLLYRMYPVQRVFFDGRSDFYGNDFVKINQRIASAEHDWKTLLHSYGIQLVVLKPQLPLSAVLKLTPGAHVLFDDGKVIVFDTTGIYKSFSDKSDAANRAVSVSRTVPSLFGDMALNPNRSNKSQKGKTS